MLKLDKYQPKSFNKNETKQNTKGNNMPFQFNHIIIYDIMRNEASSSSYKKPKPNFKK